MKYTILVLLFYCSLQVAAENSTLDVSDQNQPDLERDRKNCAENEHRLQEQYWAHLSTLDLALKTIDISLPVFEKRIMELEKEVVKSRQLQNSLQDKLLQLQNTTAGESNNLWEKKSIEEELKKIMLQIVQLDSELNYLKHEKEYISVNFKVVLEKQKNLGTSLNDLQSFGTPLENIETHLKKQLAQAQETLRTERKIFQSHLQTTSKFMELKLKCVETLKNLTIFNLNSRLVYGNQKLNESLEQNLLLISQLKIAKDNELQLVLANNVTISNLNKRIDNGNKKLNETLEQNLKLISQLKIAKENEMRLALANNLNIARLEKLIETEKEKHKDVLVQNRNLKSQLEIAMENERRLHSMNNATLKNLTVCNEAAKREQENAFNQVKNLESKLTAALKNVTILLSSLNEKTATNMINEQNLVKCYNTYNTSSAKEADLLQQNKNITEILKNCEISNSNSSTQNIKLNLVLLYQNTIRNAEDLQRKLALTNFSISNLLEEYAMLKKRNSGLAELNTYITRANGFNREENPTLSLKIKEINQNITLKTEEIYKLLQNNFNLILSNQNTAKNAEDLQQKLTSMNFSTSILRNEIEKLKENNSNLILSNQNTAKNAEDLQQKITSSKFSPSTLKNEIVKLKEELNKYINTRDGDNRTPLMRAARDNQTSTVKALIDIGANLDLQDKDNITALILAIINRNTEICKMLLDVGADVNIRTNAGNSALIYASFRNSIEMVKMLLAKGAQVNFAEDDGDTALHDAASYANVEVAKLLVGHGANINAKAKDGATPLRRALSKNRTEVANYLKSVGATE